MEIGAILVGLAILSVSLTFLAAPFKPGRKGASVNPAAGADSAGGRVAALAALRDLDFDFRTGKVSEEDYSTLRAGLLAEAAQSIQQEEARDAEIEALIQARRQARGEQPASFCSQCGRPLKSGDLFCSSCGNRLET